MTEQLLLPAGDAAPDFGVGNELELICLQVAVSIRQPFLDNGVGNYAPEFTIDEVGNSALHSIHGADDTWLAGGGSA